MTLVFLLVVIAVLIIIQNTSRKQEVESSLDEAIDMAMSETYLRNDSYNHKPENDYDYTDTAKSMLMEFNELLLSQISSDSRLAVKVIGIDKDKGEMDIQVEEIFPYPNGTTGKVEARRTMILHRIQPTPQPPIAK